MLDPVRPPERVMADLDGVQRLSPSAVVHELVGALGAQLVAAIANVSETRRVRAWQEDEQPQRIEALRAALQATRAIVAGAGSATARAWLTGCCAALDFVSPLEVLRENTQQGRTRVIQAAVAFAQQ